MAVDGASNTDGRLTGREVFSRRLRDLKLASSFTYAELASKLDRPRTTVHGWFAGRHLPYQRDNADFRRVLLLLGVDAAAVPEWMAELSALRDSPVDGQSNPYLGLSAFTEADTQYYFGREQLVAHLVETVTSAAEREAAYAVVVLGPSGAGKTSLLRAGLGAALVDEGRPVTFVAVDSDDWPEALDSIAETMSDGGPRPVLIVDQLEALFAETLDDGCRAVLDLLAETSASGAQVVVGLRSDFFHRAEAHPYLRESLRKAQVIVDPLVLDEVMAAIMRPAEEAGIVVDPELLVRLVNEFAERFEDRNSVRALPLLSHVLYRLADEAPDRRLTLTSYEAVGGLTHALEQSAEDVYQQLIPPDQEACELLFARLVELDRVEALPIRRAVRFSEIEALELRTGHALDEVVDRFAAVRLISIMRDGIEISHDALLAAWPRLAAWVEGERELLMNVRRISTATLVWSSSQSSADALLAGSQVEAAAAVLADPRGRGRLLASEIEFVEASLARAESVAASERRARTVVRSLLVLAVVAAFATAVLAFRADRAFGRADAAAADALSRQLALQSSILRDTDPSLGAQLALIAHASSATVEARSALLDAAALPGSPRYLGGSGPTAIAVGLGGQVLAVSNSVDGVITIFERADAGWDRRRVIELGDSDVDVYTLAFDPAARLLAAGGTDNRVTVWDLESGAAPVVVDDKLTQFTNHVQAVAFNASGDRLYASGTGNGIGIWDVSSGPVASAAGLAPVEDSVMGLAVDGRSEFLASAHITGSVAVWSLKSSDTPVWVVESVDGSAATSVSFAPNGELLAVGYRNGTIRVWDTSEPVAPVEIELTIEPFGSWTNSVAFSPDGSLLAAAGADGMIRMLGTEAWTQRGPLLKHPTVVTSVRFVNDNEIVAAVADGSIRTWDLTHPSMTSLDASIWSTTFDTSGRQLLLASGVRAALWSIDEGGELSTDHDEFRVELPASLTGASAISPDGQWVALGTRTGSVSLRRTDGSGEQILEGLTDLVEYMKFSDDGSLLAAAGDDGSAQIWTMLDGAARLAGRVEVSGLAMGLAFSPAGDLLVVLSSDGPAHIFDITEPGSPVAMDQIGTGDSLALSAAFHPRQPFMATGNADSSITVWDIADPGRPTPSEQLVGPNSRIFSLDFDTTGARLAASVGDNTVWVWDTGEPGEATVDAVLNAPSQAMFSVQFSPNDNYLVGAGADQHPFVWPLDTSDVISSICARVGDSITEREWATYLPDQRYDPPCALDG